MKAFLTTWLVLAIGGISTAMLVGAWLGIVYSTFQVVSK